MVYDLLGTKYKLNTIASFRNRISVSIASKEIMDQNTTWDSRSNKAPFLTFFLNYIFNTTATTQHNLWPKRKHRDVEMRVCATNRGSKRN